MTSLLIEKITTYNSYIFMLCRLYSIFLCENWKDVVF